MARMACINIAGFFIQLLVKKHRDWRNCPIVVLDKDISCGKVLMANKAAQKAGIFPGMRYANALSLVNHLRSGTLSGQEVEEARALIADNLRRFSPCTESSKEEPGIFWISANGLGTVYPSLREWAIEISTHLRSLGFPGTIVVGFSRFGTYATAKSSRGVILFENKQAELTAGRQVKIVSLAGDNRFIDRLTQLDITTVDEFVRLPGDGVLRRFGKEAYQLHRFAAADRDLPLQSDAFIDPVIEIKDFNYPVESIQALKPTFEQLLTSALDRLTRKRENLKVLSVNLNLEDGEKIPIAIHPAVPTRDKGQIVTLMSLRLENVKLSSGVIEICLQAEGAPLSDEPVDLFVDHSRGDETMANRALDLIRSEFGNDTVVHAKLHNDHRPEKRFQWVPFKKVKRPGTCSPLETLRLVRRIILKPHRLDSSLSRGERNGPQTNAFHTDRSPKMSSCKTTTKYRDGAALKSDFFKEGSLLKIPQTVYPKRMLGPYVISGGWWADEFNREYYYAELTLGELLWVYYDCLETGWFLQGDIA